MEWNNKCIVFLLPSLLPFMIRAMYSVKMTVFFEKVTRRRILYAKNL